MSLGLARAEVMQRGEQPPASLSLGRMVIKRVATAIGLLVSTEIRKEIAQYECPGDMMMCLYQTYMFVGDDLDEEASRLLGKLMFRGRGQHNALNSEIMFIRTIYGAEQAASREKDTLRHVRDKAFDSDDAEIMMFKCSPGGGSDGLSKREQQMSSRRRRGC